MKKLLTGFTLAEVLITLGIIGIVAALTMPALIAKYQEQVLRTQFQKAWSIYSQNLQKTALIDFSGDVNCAYNAAGSAATNSGCKEFFKAFVANMNVIKTCAGNALTGGCVPRYEAYMPDDNGCGGYSENGINNRNTAYVMKDGSIMIPYIYGNVDMPLFLFDVNGFKGPNKSGSDVFSIAIKEMSPGAVAFNPDITCCWYMGTALFKTLDDIYK